MTKSESDDLAAQIRTLPTIRREMIGELIGKQYVLDLVEAHLDRDRKMKAELAKLTEDYMALAKRWKKNIKKDFPEEVLELIESYLAKLEAADSKTEASE